MKKSQLITLIIGFTLVFCTSARSLKVYKHVDKDGIIHYSGKKPVGKSYHILNIKCPECSKWRNSVNWYTTPLVTDKFSSEINHAANKWEIDSSLIKAIIHAESSFKEKANSSAGAQGLMQLMPGTQKTYKVTNPYNPSQNINAGTAYLKHLMNTYSNLDVALAAYNSGETAVERYGKTIPPFPETQEYVRRVKILMKRY
ncbi:MAG: lytic transglycosylase domain-containing protein [Proteobacteria bacterium]|nr:lytic transglycosylase domain-containing protein [Pseudomonadota bacterium]